MSRTKKRTGTRPRRQDRAGATPLCAAFSRPRNRGVTPALSRSLREAVLAACIDRSVDFVMQVALQTSSEEEEVSWHF